jgi:hypothetical protein
LIKSTQFGGGSGRAPPSSIDAGKAGASLFMLDFEQAEIVQFSETQFSPPLLFCL